MKPSRGRGEMSAAIARRPTPPWSIPALTRTRRRRSASCSTATSCRCAMPAADDRARVSARAPRAHRHQGRLRRRRLRRLHGRVLGELDARARHAICARSTPASARSPRSTARQLVTVESLQAADGALHPVQQAMVDCHGSQCGFCTPGFVMSLFALYKRGRAPTRADDRRRARRQPVPLHRLPADHRCRRRMRCAAYPHGARHWLDAAGVRMAATSERAIAQRLRALERTNSLRLRTQPAYVAPRTLDELAPRCASASRRAAARRRHRRRPLGDQAAAGAAADHLSSATSRSCSSIARRRRITRDRRGGDPDRCVSRRSSRDYPSSPSLARASRSPPIRNAGTLGGNIANGSPIGDSMPVLIALGATRRAAPRRRARASCRSRSSTSAIRRRRSTPGEFVARVRVPLRDAGAAMRAATRSRSASTRTSRRSAPAFALDARRRRVCEARASPTAAWRRSRKRAHAVRARRSIGPAWDEARSARRGGAALDARTSRRITDMRASARATACSVARRNLLRALLARDAASPAPSRRQRVASRLDAVAE